MQHNIGHYVVLKIVIQLRIVYYSMKVYASWTLVWDIYNIFIDAGTHHIDKSKFRANELPRILTMQKPSNHQHMQPQK